MVDDNLQLTELQLAVLRILWRRGEARVAEVHEQLHGERDLALSTVATLLTRLEKRGIVEHRSEGRQYVYKALVSEEKVCRSMVFELADRLFTGDVAQLVNHALDAREMAPGDLKRIKDMIAAKERDLGE